MTLHIVEGPPAAGKSTWVKQHAKPGDITIDFDNLTRALSPLLPDPRDAPEYVKQVVKAARRAAIDAAQQYATQTDIYYIWGAPTPKGAQFYTRLGAQIITIDPGEDVVYERCQRERPPHILAVAKDWYAARATTHMHNGDAFAAAAFFGT